MRGQTIKGPRPSRAKPDAEALARPLKARPYAHDTAMRAAIERTREFTAAPSLIGSNLARRTAEA